MSELNQSIYEINAQQIDVQTPSEEDNLCAPCLFRGSTTPATGQFIDFEKNKYLACKSCYTDALCVQKRMVDEMRVSIGGPIPQVNLDEESSGF